MRAPRNAKAPASVEIDPRAARAILRGHPWVWRDAVRKAPSSLGLGEPVVVRARDIPFVGYALWDPSSPIALRIYARTPQEPFGIDTIARGIERAAALRDELFEDGTTSAYRVCNGEGDRVPGIVIDRYDTAAIVRLDGDAIGAWQEPLIEAIWRILRPRGIDGVGLRGMGRTPSVETLAGRPLPPTIEVVEHGMRMRVDLAHGQKTGAFLDQRENRRRVRELSRGRRVLNLFSYAGGFSCAAALGGATHVTSVDIAQGAHAAAQKSFDLNGLRAADHAFVTADAFAWLEQAARRGQAFDLVISDPPSFAPNEKSAGRALGAYRKLHQACAAVTAPGGILCAASCSSHVDMESFLETLDDDALGAERFVVWGAWGPPEDHPTPAAWAEGRYLKFVVLRDRNR